MVHANLLNIMDGYTCETVIATLVLTMLCHGKNYEILAHRFENRRPGDENLAI